LPKEFGLFFANNFRWSPLHLAGEANKFFCFVRAWRISILLPFRGKQVKRARIFPELRGSRLERDRIFPYKIPDKSQIRTPFRDGEYTSIHEEQLVIQVSMFIHV
jgi:hypothetical protein